MTDLSTAKKNIDAKFTEITTIFQAITTNVEKIREDINTITKTMSDAGINAAPLAATPDADGAPLAAAATPDAADAFGAAAATPGAFGADVGAADGAAGDAVGDGAGADAPDADGTAAVTPNFGAAAADGAAALGADGTPVNVVAPVDVVAPVGVTPDVSAVEPNILLQQAKDNTSLYTSTTEYIIPSRPDKPLTYKQMITRLEQNFKAKKNITRDETDKTKIILYELSNAKNENEVKDIFTKYDLEFENNMFAGTRKRKANKSRSKFRTSKFRRNKSRSKFRNKSNRK